MNKFTLTLLIFIFASGFLIAQDNTNSNQPYEGQVENAQKVINVECANYGIKFYGFNSEKNEKIKSCIPARFFMIKEQKEAEADAKNYCFAVSPQEQKDIMKSIVYITSETRMRNNLPSGRGGTGGIIKIVKGDKLEIYILTAPHVIGDDVSDFFEAKIGIKLDDGSDFKAEILKAEVKYAVNWLYEMILLKATLERNEDLESKIQELKISETNLNKWDDVILAGYPAGINVVKTGDVVFISQLLFPLQLSDGSWFQINYNIGIDSSGLLGGGISGGAVLNCQKEINAVVWGGFEHTPFLMATPINDESQKWLKEFLK